MRLLRYYLGQRQTANDVCDLTQITPVPSLETAREVISQSRNSKFAPNLLPVTASIPADLLTPTLAYLKLAEK